MLEKQIQPEQPREYNLPRVDELIKKLTVLRDKIGWRATAPVAGIASDGEVKIGNFCPQYGAVQRCIRTDLPTREELVKKLEAEAKTFLAKSEAERLEILTASLTNAGERLPKTESEREEELREAYRASENTQTVVGPLTIPEGFKARRVMPGKSSLLEFNFGETQIILEDAPIYCVTDERVGGVDKLEWFKKRYTFVHHLANSEQDLANPTYVFNIKVKNEPLARFSVSSSGQVTFLNLFHEPAYRDAVIGELTINSESFEDRGLKDEVVVKRGYTKIDLTRWQRFINLLAGPNFYPPKKWGVVGRQVEKRRDITKHNNVLVGDQTTVATLPNAKEAAAVLTHLVSEGIRALEVDAKTMVEVDFKAKKKRSKLKNS